MALDHTKTQKRGLCSWYCWLPIPAFLPVSGGTGTSSVNIFVIHSFRRCLVQAEVVHVVSVELRGQALYHVVPVQGQGLQDAVWSPLLLMLLMLTLV